MEWVGAQAFEGQDNQIYDELKDIIPGGFVYKGEAALIEDVFGFYFKQQTRIGGVGTEEITFVYRMRQVLAKKITGTGNDIKAGDRVWYITASGAISNTKPGGGAAGTDYFFCGWAKEDAEAGDTEVLINFDGTLYNII